MEHIPIVKNYMITRLITLTRDMDVYFAIGLLLKNRISGAPVIDDDNNLVEYYRKKIACEYLQMDHFMICQ